MDDREQDHGNDSASRLLARFKELLTYRAKLVMTQRMVKAVAVADELEPVALELYRLTSLPAHERNIEYARYYRAITWCLHLLQKEDFSGSRRQADAALAAAARFRRSNRFFPNFFFDERDIATYGIYVSALESFRGGNFARAEKMFNKWLSQNWHRENAGDTKFDSNYFAAQVSAILAAMDRGHTCLDLWRLVEQTTQSSNLNLPRTARALWDLVEPLKAAAIGGGAAFPGGQAAAVVLIDRIRDNWLLLNPSTRLKGTQRHSSLEEQVRLPACLDVFRSFETGDNQWRFVFKQAIRNALLLRADYESMRARIHSRPPGVLLTGPALEQLSDIDLSNYLRSLFSLVKGKADQSILAASLMLWFDARRAVRGGERSRAEYLADEFFKRLRSLPHVVRVRNCRRIEDTLDGEVQYELILERLWHDPHREMIFESEFSSDTGSMLYLSPRWNRSLKRHYRLRLEGGLPLRSRMPEWMTLFVDWAYGRGPVDPHIFLRWCEQIAPSRRSTALKLLTRFSYLGDQDVRELWGKILKDLPSQYLESDTIYVALGRAAKSGNAQLISLKQAVTQLPELAGAINPKTAFRSEESLRDEDVKVKSVIFVDDFIGTGQQAVEFLRSALDRFPWLRTRKVQFCATCGFSSAISSLSQAVNPLGIGVTVGRILDDCMRAFAPENDVWESEADRLQALQWCNELGAKLLSGQFKDPAEHALGWKGSQGLVAFHYNTPNNTLPLFWAAARIDGKDWTPLFPRF